MVRLFPLGVSLMPSSSCDSVAVDLNPFVALRRPSCVFVDNSFFVVSDEGGLRQQLGDDLAADVGQSGIPSAELEGQPGVVDSQQVQDGGLNVVHVNPVLDR